MQKEKIREFFIHQQKIANAFWISFYKILRFFYMFKFEKRNIEQIAFSYLVFFEEKNTLNMRYPSSDTTQHPHSTLFLKCIPTIFVFVRRSDLTCTQFSFSKTWKWYIQNHAFELHQIRYSQLQIE